MTLRDSARENAQAAVDAVYAAARKPVSRGQGSKCSSRVRGAVCELPAGHEGAHWDRLNLYDPAARSWIDRDKSDFESAPLSRLDYLRAWVVDKWLWLHSNEAHADMFYMVLLGVIMLAGMLFSR